MQARTFQWAAALLTAVGLAAAAGAQDAGQRRQDFAADPGWESFRSRLLPDPPRPTRQEFGFRKEGRFGPEGEIGGWIQRSVTPASYALRIPPRTLSGRLSASGKFAVARDEGGSGVCFGWFNSGSRGWRTSNSLVFRLDGNGGKYWVFYEYGTRGWLTGGAGCFEGDRYQTTPTKPFPSDGTVHEWSMEYDPGPPDAPGELCFTLDGKEYRLAVLPEHKKDGATFNRFGVFNQMISGDGMDAFFGDLVLDGRPVDPGRDPRWEGRGNRTAFPERVLRPFHDFGHSRTAHAGGKPGELGGVVWRDEKPAFYADRVGPLSLDQPLYASGTLTFRGAGSDSGVYLGWFDAEAKRKKETSDIQEGQKSFLAILLEGPSRDGHYFRPGYAASDGRGITRENGPILRPDGKLHRWSLQYDPKAGESGRITLRLDGGTQTLDLKPEHRKQGASFDRFGLFNLQAGGHYVEVYLDDLGYSSGR